LSSVSSAFPKEKSFVRQFIDQLSARDVHSEQAAMRALILPPIGPEGGQADEAGRGDFIV